MTNSVLIAGASGRFGRNAAAAFENAGWRVRRFNRASDTLLQAAQGADVIVNALNPPNYKNWPIEIPRITSMVIDAARKTSATVLIPGNVYNFGTAPAPWAEHTPHQPNSIKGEIRAEMERQYRAAAKDGVQTIILRAGDFIDTEASGNFFDMVIAKDAARGKFVYPGNTDIKHSWAYLPDLANTAVSLANKRGTLNMFEDIPFEGFSLTGRELMALVAQVTNQPQKLKSFPWPIIELGAYVIPLWRELLEMRYLWDHPHTLDPTRLAELLPENPRTSPRIALSGVLKIDIDPNQAMVGTHRFT